jgi:FixJ family two-component response regulator
MNHDCIIYVVDDDASVRKSIRWLLESANYPTRCFASGQEFLANYDPSLPACLLLDVRMPGESGLQLQKMLDSKQIPIIFVSGHVDVRTASQAFRAGACDVLAKPVESKLLLERVEEALATDRLNRQHEQQLQAKQALLTHLTPKERQVFQQMLEGRTIKQLAVHFEITFQTAAKHRSRILEKLGVETDAQLVRSFQDCVE